MGLQQCGPCLQSTPFRELSGYEPVEQSCDLLRRIYLHLQLTPPLECVCTCKYISRRRPDPRRSEMAQTASEGREYEGLSIPPAGRYELDQTHTVVGFVARHMLSKVRGSFTEFTGAIEVGDSPENSRVEVEVKTNSSTTHNETRDQHS